MPDSDSHPLNYPTVEFLIGAVADWVNKYRRGTGVHKEFQQCGPDEVMQIARDLGVTASELRAIASKDPGGADLLKKLLAALHVEPNQISKANPGVMRDLQRLCVSCADKKRCRNELAAGTAAERFHDYCPNAYTLDALFKEKPAAVKH